MSRSQCGSGVGIDCHLASFAFSVARLVFVKVLILHTEILLTSSLFCSLGTIKKYSCFWTWHCCKYQIDSLQVVVIPTLLHVCCTQVPYFWSEHRPKHFIFFQLWPLIKNSTLPISRVEQIISNNYINDRGKSVDGDGNCRSLWHSMGEQKILCIYTYTT